MSLAVCCYILADDIGEKLNNFMYALGYIFCTVSPYGRSTSRSSKSNFRQIHCDPARNGYITVDSELQLCAFATYQRMFQYNKQTRQLWINRLTEFFSVPSTTSTDSSKTETISLGRIDDVT